MSEQTTPWEDLFSDEWGTVWVRKEGRTEEDAKRIVKAVEGEPDDGFDVRAVRANVGLKYGEPWLTPDPEGPEEFWEVSF